MSKMKNDDVSVQPTYFSIRYPVDGNVLRVEHYLDPVRGVRQLVQVENEQDGRGYSSLGDSCPYVPDGGLFNSEINL